MTNIPAAPELNIHSNMEKENAFWSLIRPLVLKTIVGSVAAAGLVGVLAVIVGEFGTLHTKAILTIILVVAFALLAWYDAEVSSKRASTFAMVGLITSALLLIVGLAKIWVFDSHGIFDGFGDCIWLLIVARVALLHAHLLLNIHEKYATPLLQLVAKVTLVLIACFGTLIVIPSIFDGIDFSNAYWRLVWAVGILDVVGTVLIPLSYALFGPKSENKQPSFFTYEGSPDGLREARVGWEEAHVVEEPLVPAYTPPTEPTQHETWDRQPEPAPQAPLPYRGVQQPKGAIVFDAPPGQSRRLAWPTYTDGTPLPVGPDGMPDFSEVERY